MSPSLIDIQKRIAKIEEEYYRNLEENLRYIKRRVTELLGDARVYVFGSVVEGKYVPGKSDIDVLIVSSRIPKTASELVELKLKILGDLGFLSPFEIHFADGETFEHYRRSAKIVEVKW